MPAWRVGSTTSPPVTSSPGENIDFTKSIRNGPTTRGFDYYFGTAVPNFPLYCFIEHDRTAFNLIFIPSNTSDSDTFLGGDGGIGYLGTGFQLTGDVSLDLGGQKVSTLLG